MESEFPNVVACLYAVFTDPILDWSEATTEIQSIHENPYSFSEASRSTSPEDTERPFLSVQSSPVRNELRIWESNAPTDSNFTIWEDPPNIETPVRLSPAEWVDLEDDKENNYATVSDYDSEEEESQEPRIDWVTVTPGPRDVFGLPIGTPTRPPVHGLAGGGHLVTPVVVPPMPADTEMNFRIARRVITQDEQDIEEEWDDSLSSNQIRELQELNDIYTRRVEHRRLHGRQFPMRDSNGQGQANVFLEARRITEFQRHESRRRSNGDLDED